jgi:type I restriction enzyme S subunit
VSIPAIEDATAHRGPLWIRLRRFARLNPSRTEVAHLPDNLEVTFLPMERVSEQGEVDHSTMRTLGDIRSGYTYFRDGDVVVAKITPCFENGKSAWIQGCKSGVGFGTTEFHVIRAEPEVTARYLSYVVRSSEFLGRGAAAMSGAAGQQRVPEDFVLDFPVYLPPLPTQRAIADFLDRKTAALDGLIARKERLLELLAERRAALIDSIFRSVTATPVRLRHLVDLLTGYAFASDAYSQDDDDVRLVRGVNVGVGQLRWDEVVRWPRERLTGLDRYLLEPGDVVLGMDRPWISTGLRVASVRPSDCPSLLLQRVARLRGGKSLRNAFLLYSLLWEPFRAHLEPETTGVSIPHISGEQILSYSIPLPPIGEQDRLCERLDNASRRLDETAQVASTQLSLLREYRQALITAAVTGQLEIPEVPA